MPVHCAEEQIHGTVEARMATPQDRTAECEHIEVAPVASEHRVVGKAKSRTTGWQIVLSTSALSAPASSLPGLHHAVPDAFLPSRILCPSFQNGPYIPTFPDLNEVLSVRVQLPTHITKAAGRPGPLHTTTPEPGLTSCVFLQREGCGKQNSK